MTAKFLCALVDDLGLSLLGLCSLGTRDCKRLKLQSQRTNLLLESFALEYSDSLAGLVGPHVSLSESLVGIPLGALSVGDLLAGGDDRRVAIEVVLPAEAKEASAATAATVGRGRRAGVHG